MKLLVPPLYLSANEGFTSELDIFNRKPFGESLLNLIQNTDDELVLALDAPWGEGKSTFIRMWQGLLAEKHVKHIYFDAFENDYQPDPFLAISSHIYSLIDKGDEESHKEFKQKATSALKVVGRAGLRIGIKALTAGVLDETIVSIPRQSRGL
ncbi:MAG: KAP family NTPase [Candidatus Thiodiazotropha sp. (ex. Lucinisca nassula)]|nr:KAP family NTPase [Candidatus Thiodiazotropha sp. (ex. Lucinisca nassula)]MBW9276121.1 KAP family NTPase [Candidatus Thiodiazotropha sp. (ex. Lucinisca nassula)]